MEYQTSGVTSHQMRGVESQGAYVGHVLVALSQTIREMNLVGSDHWKAEQHILKMALPDSTSIGGKAPVDRPLFAEEDKRPDTQAELRSPCALLAMYGDPITVRVFYEGLKQLGFVDRVVRSSESLGSTGYWRLTPAGTWIGRNRIHEDSFVDTQVHIFSDRFPALLALMGIKAKKLKVSQQVSE